MLTQAWPTKDSYIRQWTRKHEVQGLLRVYQSTSQLLYLTSEGQRPWGPHSIFWLVGLVVFSCMRKKKEEERDEGRKERGAWRDWGWGVVVVVIEVQKRFGLRPLASRCASSSQCKGLELLLDGIFSPVASAVRASIWRTAVCTAESQPLSDTAIKNNP